MMLPEQEWVKKALNDLGSAKLMLDSNSVYFDQTCFLCQQCIEKLLKAYLAKNKTEISKTHDLVKLVGDCSKVNEEFLQWKNDALTLTTYAVDFRYPGEEATKEEAIEAYQKAEAFSKFIFNKLNAN